jgi:hypothetical protein
MTEADMKQPDSDSSWSARLPTIGSMPLLLGIGAYVVAWLLTAVVGELFWGSSLPRASSAILGVAFFIPLCLTAAVSYWSTHPGGISRAVQVFFSLGALIVVLNVVVFRFDLLHYGDSGELSRAITLDFVFARRLLGASVLNLLYRGIVAVLEGTHLAAGGLDADAYVRILGAIVMAISSVLLLSRHPNQLAVPLALATPIWFLLASGYNEYYPFIAPAFLFVLVSLAETRLQRVRAWVVALLAAALGLLYAGFAPIALIILVAYAAAVGLRAGLRAATLAVVFALALVVIAWQGSLLGFLRNYVYELNLGELHTFYAAYVGKSVSGTPFFVPAYVFSTQHVGHLFFMYFWAGGLSPVLLCIAAAIAIRHHLFDSLDDLRFASVATIFVFELAYFLLMIAKLGPVKDIDLFFSVYLTVAFVAGSIVDRCIRNLPTTVGRLWQTAIWSAFMGNTAFVLLHLLLVGLPQPA